ncbi:MAG TPA: DUF3010 family protein [Arcobacter sp.]|nr:DUF3010 family protein [Arcobacter sp.]HIP55406.1 DUF3010 family protein [Arcobacter sp.]
MKVCGIELKANNIILCVVENNQYQETQIKKIQLLDDENQNKIFDIRTKIETFFIRNDIKKVVIKKRAKKGNFAGGAITFKLESIIQLNNICKVDFVSSQALSKYQKKNEIEFSSSLNKYQEQAYLAAIYQ